MEVFHCEAPADVAIPEYTGDCDFLPAEAKVCSKVITLWAMGASTFTYPPMAGLPVGGADFNPYIRIEIHYNNPNELAGKMLEIYVKKNDKINLVIIQGLLTVPE